MKTRQHNNLHLLCIEREKGGRGGGDNISQGKYKVYMCRTFGIIRTLLFSTNISRHNLFIAEINVGAIYASHFSRVECQIQVPETDSMK